LRAAQVLGIGRTSLYRYLKLDQQDRGLQVKLRGARRGRIPPGLILHLVDARLGKFLYSSAVEKAQRQLFDA
jgi:hypothetical protein